MNRRAEILHELARFDTPSEPLVRELTALGWDWEGDPLLVLTKDHFIRVMDRFLATELTAEQLHQWAENLEVREDVAFDSEDEELLDGVFFQLAVPEINRPLTVEVVQELKQALAEHGI